MPHETLIEAPDSDRARGPECVRTPERLARYLHGGASPAEHAEFRTHRRTCASCSKEFREALMLATEIVSERRESRSKKARAERRARRRASAIEGADRRASRFTRGRRNAHLRLILMPAFAVFIMLGVYPATRSWGPPRVALTVSTGAVLVSGETVAAGDEARTLQRGDWCVPLAGGAAQLVLGETRLGLRAGTRILIENSFDLRVRLDAGGLEIEGPCVVTTEAGIVEVQAGSGQVALLAEGLRVHSETGAWSASNSRGARRLEADETVLLGRP